MRDGIENILLAMMEEHEHRRLLARNGKNPGSDEDTRRFRRTLVPPNLCRSFCVNIVLIPLPEDIGKTILCPFEQVVKITLPRLLRELYGFEEGRRGRQGIH